MVVANIGLLQMLKTVIMDFSVIKPQFSRRLSRIFFSAGSQLSRIFRGRLAGLAQIAASGRLDRSAASWSTPTWVARMLFAKAVLRDIMSSLSARTKKIYI